MREEMAELRSALKGLVEERSRAFTSPAVKAQADSPAPSYFSSPSSPGQVTGGHSVIACSSCGRPISCDGPASPQRVCTLCQGKAAAPVPNFPFFTGPSSSGVGNVERDGSSSHFPGVAPSPVPAYFPAQGQQHAGQHSEELIGSPPGLGSATQVQNQQNHLHFNSIFSTFPIENS